VGANDRNGTTGHATGGVLVLHRAKVDGGWESRLSH
jgi:hypothetical protein